MFILHFLPDSLIFWVVNLILLAGGVLTIVGFFVRSVPIINRYQLPFQLLGIALLTIGMYLRGGYAIEQQWRERVADVEKKLVAAEEKSKIATAKIDTQTIEKIKVIQGREVVVKQYIDREVVKYNNSCVIPTEFVKAHNDAAERPR